MIWGTAPLCWDDIYVESLTRITPGIPVYLIYTLHIYIYAYETHPTPDTRGLLLLLLARPVHSNEDSMKTPD